MPLAYTISETAEQLRCSRTHVYSEIRSGRLKTFTLGARRLVSHDQLVAFINALAAKPSPISEKRSQVAKQNRAAREVRRKEAER